MDKRWGEERRRLVLHVQQDERVFLDFKKKGVYTENKLIAEAIAEFALYKEYAKNKSFNDFLTGQMFDQV